MVSISDRLKALGVKVGSQDLPAPAERAEHPIEEVVDGELKETSFGDAFVVDQFFPGDHIHGSKPLRFPANLDAVAAWARDARIAAYEAESFLFLDTETTGLASGSGTFAFLVGVGRFEEGGFRQLQFFLRDPLEEPAMLAALEEFAAPSEALVTFNGKSFDLPLLNARYLTNSAPPPFNDPAHLDLLHLARRLWRDVLPSRALGDLEHSILGIPRSDEEVPGWEIPQLYIDYLRSGDARPLKGVFYHNSMDVLSMASLLNHMAAMLAQPMDGPIEHPNELYAIGRLFADLGFTEEAIEIYRGTLEQELDEEVHYRLVENLACLHRRRDEYEHALQLWELAAGQGHVYAHVEIAKYYEHKVSDFETAASYTRSAIEIISTTKASRFERVHWQEKLEYRLERLERKLAKKNGN